MSATRSKRLIWRSRRGFMAFGGGKLAVLVIWRSAPGDAQGKAFVTRDPIRREVGDPERPGVVFVDLWESEEEFRRLSGVPGSDVVAVYDAGPSDSPAV